jgi:hypothetical protein
MTSESKIDSNTKGDDMKKNTAATVALTALLAGLSVALPGCVETTDTKNYIPENLRYVAHTIPTERQIQIARDLGCPEEAIRSFKKDGLSHTGFQRIMAAEMLLDHLENKYNETFKPLWISTPWLMDNKYELCVVATSGPFAPTPPFSGDEFRVSYMLGPEEAPAEEHIYETYFRALFEEEFEGHLKRLVHEVYDDTKAGGVLIDVTMGTGGRNYTFGPDTDLWERRTEVYGSMEIFLPPWCELSKEEYDALSEKLKRHMETNKMDVSWSICVITIDVDELNTNAALIAMRDSTEEHPTYKWLEHIHVRSSKLLADEGEE